MFYAIQRRLACLQCAPFHEIFHPIAIAVRAGGVGQNLNGCAADDNFIAIQQTIGIGIRLERVGGDPKTRRHQKTGALLGIAQAISIAVACAQQDNQPGRIFSPRIPHRPFVTNHPPMMMHPASRPGVFHDDGQHIPGRPIRTVENLLHNRRQVGAGADLPQLPAVTCGDMPGHRSLSEGTILRAAGETKGLCVSAGFAVEDDRQFIGVRPIHGEFQIGFGDLRAWRQDTFGALTAYGVATMIAFQALVNIGVNLNLLPVTGLTLPFVSYGGSSLLSALVGIGLVESVILRHKALEFSQ